jgi:hypothetical protein
MHVRVLGGDHIMTLILIGGAAGVVLGLRYKVLVLIPIMCVALAVVALDAVAHGGGLGRMTLMMFSIVTSLQFGYILGAIVMHTIARPRPHQQRLPTPGLPTASSLGAPGR